MRRGVLPVVGGVIIGVQRAPCPRKPLLISPEPCDMMSRVKGKTIETVDRIGKRVALRLSSGDTMIFEPRMTGLVLLADSPDDLYLRFRMQIKGAAAKELLYWDRRGLGSIRLLTADEVDIQYGPAKLGPDALQITATQLQQHLKKSSREIKVALLDQRAVAGIGNLYASEILHYAGVHPQTRCNRLTIAQWEAIHQYIGKVLHTAIRYEGSTLSDGTYRNALNKAGGYQNHHRVYAREGEICPACQKTPITRIVQAQRSTFFCKTCQTRRPAETDLRIAHVIIRSTQIRPHRFQRTRRRRAD